MTGGARDRLRAAGFRVGRDLEALEALRARVGPGATLPAPRHRWWCPSCWTALPADVEPSFPGCPSCGHGLVRLVVRDPWRCVDCGRISEGQPEGAVHRRIDEDGLEGPPCSGATVPDPYLPFDVAWRGAELLVVPDPATPPEALPAGVPLA